VQSPEVLGLVRAGADRRIRTNAPRGRGVVVCGTRTYRRAYEHRCGRSRRQSSVAEPVVDPRSRPLRWAGKPNLLGDRRIVSEIFGVRNSI
jgi:hypothetical protein